MNKLEKNIQKRINTLIQLTGEYPKQIDITLEEYNYLKENNLLINNKYTNIKLNIKN